MVVAAPSRPTSWPTAVNMPANRRPVCTLLRPALRDGPRASDLQTSGHKCHAPSSKLARTPTLYQAGASGKCAGACSMVRDDARCMTSCCGPGSWRRRTHSGTPKLPKLPSIPDQPCTWRSAWSHLVAGEVVVFDKHHQGPQALPDMQGSGELPGGTGSPCPGSKPVPGNVTSHVLSRLRFCRPRTREMFPGTGLEPGLPVPW